MSVESEYLPPDPDSEGCLCIVASYSDLAPAVGPVAAEAAKRIMMSPALGDFIELRFTDIGPRPGHAGEHGDAAAVAILTDELMHPASGVGRNYFALVIADTSAATAERLLSNCATAPPVAGLPIRFFGIASSDDRQLTPQSGQAVEIVVSPTGSWSRDALVNELRSYGEEVLRYFATGHAPGLSRDELDLLRSRNEQPLAQQPGSPVDESRPSPEPGQETVAPIEAVPAPDILTPQMETAQPGDLRVPEGAAHLIEEPPRASEQSSRTPVEPSRAPEQSSRTPVEPSRAPEQSSRTPVEPSRAPEPVRPAQPPPQSRRHWRPAVRWRRGHEAEPETGAGEIRASGLVYLIITGDNISSDHAAWRNIRSMLLDVDEKIAATPLFAYKVRAPQISQDSVQGALRAAGQLSRRDIRPPVTDQDFAAVLGSIRIMLKIDRAAIQTGAAPMAWPAVVFFATDPPLADTVTAEVYRELAKEASIIWVVLRDSADLVAPVFTEAPDTLLLVYHHEVVDEVVSLLTSSTRVRGSNAEAHLLLHGLALIARPVPDLIYDAQQYDRLARGLHGPLAKPAANPLK